ncbi:MAG: isoprenylcysteine carboxylmethyltransferase family protein [Gammaproteobacteria bacterium]|nr:isoprenylcysteine carboxylmethyltransferase family protein [Gammaproteobacteria bacterium]
MKRLTAFFYGLACYAVFFATFLYAIGWVGDLYLPVTIDSAPLIPTGYALLVNIGLLTLFALQHSIMARPAFKRWWTQYVPEQVERSTYVLFSSLALIAMFVFWQPLGGMIWQVENTAGAAILYSLFGIGWLLVLVATFLINHFDLFGLRQVWLYLLNREYTPLKFKTPGAYKFVRHPMYIGWFFAFWATPVMTAGHLFFALITTAYILLAIRLEERDLLTALGEDYAEYRKNVPMLIPWLRNASGQQEALQK